MAFIAYIQSVVPNNPFRVMVSGWAEAAAMRDRLNPKGRVLLLEAGEPKPYKPVLEVAKREKPALDGPRRWRVSVTLDYVQKVADHVTVAAPTVEEAAREAYEKVLGGGADAPAIAKAMRGLEVLEFAFHADGRMERLPERLCGSRMAERLRDRRMSLDGLAACIDRSRKCVYNLMRHKQRVDGFAMISIADALECRLSDLACRDGDKPASEEDLAALGEPRAKVSMRMGRLVRYEHYTVACDYCGKPVTLRAFELKESKHHYCSFACSVAKAASHLCPACGLRYKVKRPGTPSMGDGVRARRMNRPGAMLCALCEAELGWIG